MPSIANRKVLVLNRGWTPIAVVSLERALCLITGTVKGSSGPGKKSEPKARIIDPVNDFRTWTWEDWSDLRPHDAEEKIHGVKKDYRIPEVILLSRYNKLPHQRVNFSRRTIYKRDGNICGYCRRKFSSSDLNVEHIVPRKHGGLTTWENCIITCFDCNSRKADVPPTPITWTEGDKVVHGFMIHFTDPKHPKVTIRKPQKPEFSVFKGEYKCKSWTAFLGEAYWLTELENDNPPE